MWSLEEYFEKNKESLENNGEQRARHFWRGQVELKVKEAFDGTSGKGRVVV